MWWLKTTAIIVLQSWRPKGQEWAGPCCLPRLWGTRCWPLPGLGGCRHSLVCGHVAPVFAAASSSLMLPLQVAGASVCAKAPSAASYKDDGLWAIQATPLTQIPNCINLQRPFLFSVQGNIFAGPRVRTGHLWGCYSACPRACVMALAIRSPSQPWCLFRGRLQN